MPPSFNPPQFLLDFSNAVGCCHRFNQDGHLQRIVCSQKAPGSRVREHCIFREQHRSILRSPVVSNRPVISTLGREVNPHVLSRETFLAKVRTNDAFITNVLAAPKIWIIGGTNELGN